MGKNEKLVQAVLIDLGVTPGIKGFYYLTRSIEMVLENVMKPTMDTYYDIAKEYNTTYSRVERAIRHAITRCFDNYTPLAHKLFDGTSHHRGIVTATTFVHTVSLYVKNNMEQYSDFWKPILQ